MIIAFFRRRRYVMLQKVAAFSLAFVASLAVADPGPLPSQPGELHADSTTADKGTGLPVDALLQRQSVAMPSSSDTDATAEVEALHRFNELKRELLDDREKAVDWWLAGTAIFLTLFSVGAFFVGLFGFKRFREIEAEAREHVKSSRKHAEEAQNLVGEIKMKRDEAELLMKGLTAEAVHNDPDEARKVAESVRENPTASPIDQTVADAVLLQRQGKIKESMKRWHAVAIISQVNDKDLAAKAWFSVGYLNQEYETNSLEKAIDAYDEAIRLKPDLSAAYNNRGNVKSNLGLHEKALADYDEAVRLKPNNSEYYSNRGNAKGNLHRYEEAISDYNKAIRLKPDSPEAYSNRGVAKNDLGRHEEAIVDYDEAIRLKPDNPEAYSNLGVAKNALGRHEEAVADYDEAIRLKPNYANVYSNRGVAKNNLGRHEEAIVDYDRAIRLNPDYANAYHNRGLAKDDLGRREEAIADYDEAIRLRPNLSEAYNNRGNVKNNLGRHEEAVADYDEAIRLKPDNLGAYNNRGKANIILNRVREARQDFETAIALARAAGDEILASDAERTLKKLSGKQGP